MFQQRAPKTGAASVLSTLDVIFHVTVRKMRANHGNPIIGLLINILQIAMMVAIFYLMFAILGMRSSAVRGNFLLYVMSGIFMFMTHIKAMGAVGGAEGSTSPMMQHAPMNTVVSIVASALAALYTQILSAGVVLYVYHAAVEPLTVQHPIGVLGMLLVSWASGCAIGLIFMAAKPWAPNLMPILKQIYMRANMIASGKMFLANTMPTYILKMFDWNPLFHTIDQGRGFIFLNYNPHYSSVSYPIKVTLCCLMIGVLLEYFTRKHASLSWAAGK